jgi:hypothetical protein
MLQCVVENKHPFPFTKAHSEARTRTPTVTAATQAMNASFINCNQKTFYATFFLDYSGDICADGRTQHCREQTIYNIQGVLREIVNILGRGSMDYSE